MGRRRFRFTLDRLPPDTLPPDVPGRPAVVEGRIPVLPHRAAAVTCGDAALPGPPWHGAAPDLSACCCPVKHARSTRMADVPRRCPLPGSFLADRDLSAFSPSAICLEITGMGATPSLRPLPAPFPADRDMSAFFQPVIPRFVAHA